jgi:hypothetical protein
MAAKEKAWNSLRPQQNRENGLPDRPRHKNAFALNRGP